VIYSGTQPCDLHKKQNLKPELNFPVAALQVLIFPSENANLVFLF